MASVEQRQQSCELSHKQPSRQPSSSSSDSGGSGRSGSGSGIAPWQEFGLASAGLDLEATEALQHMVEEAERSLSRVSQRSRVLTLQVRMCTVPSLHACTRCTDQQQNTTLRRADTRAALRRGPATGSAHL